MEIKRRDFIKLLGFGGATAAVSGCSSEVSRKLIPYLIPEEEIVPGEPVSYATVCRECPAGCGMLVKTIEGRAIKVEGNPDHPVNQGRLCARGQASLQGLYNPDRVKQPLRRGSDGTLGPISWDEAEKVLVESLSKLAGQTGRIAFVTPLLTGSLDRLVDLWLAAMGGGVRLRYEAVSWESLRQASRLAFGVDEIPSYDLEKAKLLISFGADFLETWLSPVEHARQFASMRRYRGGQMGRFVYIGPRLSLTAANSDEWVAARPGGEAFIALAMIRVLLDEGLAVNLNPAETQAVKNLVSEFTPEAVAKEAGISPDAIRVLARAFSHQRPSLALVDARASNATQTCVAVNLLNYVVGNIGQTIRFGSKRAAGNVSNYRDFGKLIDSMEKGEIALLLLAGVNPLFTLPQAKRLRDALAKVPLVVSVSSFADETAAAAHLVLSESTFLESWGDYEPRDGVRGIQQPAMEPLYDTRSLGDILLSMASRAGKREKLPWNDFYTYLRAQWQELHLKLKTGDDFESFWIETVRRGGYFQEPVSQQPVRLNPEATRIKFQSAAFSGLADGLTLIPYSSLAFYDGRMANRPWLQELPDPLTQFVWDNWLEIHPEDATRLVIRESELVQVKSPAGVVKLPVHISSGVRPGTVAAPIGQGHIDFGRYAGGTGANPISLLSAVEEESSGALVWVGTHVVVARTENEHRLVSTTGSDRPYEREIVQTISLTALQQGVEAKEAPRPIQMYPEHDHPKHRWGMVIDLNACIGCGACVVACSAENNIPVMGKEQVGKGREMSWIRIQRYNEGISERPDHHFIPMLCQQCDHAPCEPVCPVYATYHNPEGINAQVYNRCVGTRYCSNNCPYKVRRFNWFTSEWPEPLNLQLNPDVTVREMGVMEKCTFCIQRIRAGELEAKKEKRDLRDGEIVPACAQTCPTQAIVFGDLKNAQSEVAKLAKDPRGYHVLEHLNTQPAITYLKKIKTGPIES